MKTYLYQSLIVLSLCSCSTESPELNSNIGTTELSAKQAYKTSNGLTSPANPDNPYDYAGVMADKILDDYYLTPGGDRSLTEITLLVEDLLTADLNADYTIAATYEIPDPVLIEQLLLNAEQDFLSDLTSAGYSSKGKLYLQSLKDALSSLKTTNSPYEDVYNLIEEIETEILNEDLPPSEKEALLITTSVLRYSLYNDTKRRRRDRDWEWSTANVAATSTGSIESVPDAIALCVISKVYNP